MVTNEAYRTQIFTESVTQLETDIVSTESTDSTKVLSASTSYDQPASKSPTGIGIILSNPMVTGKYIDKSGVLQIA